MVVPLGAKRSLPWWKRVPPSRGKLQSFMNVAPGPGHRSDGHPASAAGGGVPPVDGPEDGGSAEEADAVDLGGMVRRSPGTMRLVDLRPFDRRRAVSVMPCLRATRRRKSPRFTV